MASKSEIIKKNSFVKPLIIEWVIKLDYSINRRIVRNLADETYMHLSCNFTKIRVRAAHWFTYARKLSFRKLRDRYLCRRRPLCPRRWDSGLKTLRELNSMILRLSQ